MSKLVEDLLLDFLDLSINVSATICLMVSLQTVWGLQVLINNELCWSSSFNMYTCVYLMNIFTDHNSSNYLNIEYMFKS